MVPEKDCEWLGVCPCADYKCKENYEHLLRRCYNEAADVLPSTELAGCKASEIGVNRLFWEWWANGGFEEFVKTVSGEKGIVGAIEIAFVKGVMSSTLSGLLNCPGNERRCKDCSWRDENKYCVNEEKIHESNGRSTEKNDELIYSYNESGGFKVGGNFGCVHFKDV